MSSKTWIAFVIIVVVIFGGLVVLAKKDQVNVGNVDQLKIQPTSAASGNIAEHIYGNKSGKVTLIEYGDFQCPVCGRAYPNLHQVANDYKDKLTFVFRNNPLTTIHPNARAGSAAAEAAGLQGKYWEMHDVLYQNQDSWSDSTPDKRVDVFVNFAKTVGVKDLNKFRSDLDSRSVSDKINFDLALGKKVPVEGTPTLLLNGKNIDSSVWDDIAKLKSTIEDALK